MRVCNPFNKRPFKWHSARLTSPASVTINLLSTLCTLDIHRYHVCNNKPPFNTVHVDVNPSPCYKRKDFKFRILLPGALMWRCACAAVCEGIKRLPGKSPERFTESERKQFDWTCCRFTLPPDRLIMETAAIQSAFTMQKPFIILTFGQCSLRYAGVNGNTSRKTLTKSLEIRSLWCICFTCTWTFLYNYILFILFYILVYSRLKLASWKEQTDRQTEYKKQNRMITGTGSRQIKAWMNSDGCCGVSTHTWCLTKTKSSLNSSSL